MRIYLAGTFLTNWRIKVLNEIGLIHNIIIPGMKENEHSLARFTVYDAEVISHCDCMLAYYNTKPLSIGTGWEQGVAYDRKRKIVLVIENIITFHPLLIGSAFRLFWGYHALNVALEYFKQLKDINDLQHESEVYYRFMK